MLQVINNLLFSLLIHCLPVNAFLPVSLSVRTVMLAQSTDSGQLIAAAVIKLFHAMKLQVQDLRGVGIQVQLLEGNRSVHQESTGSRTRSIKEMLLEQGLNARSSSRGLCKVFVILVIIIVVIGEISWLEDQYYRCCWQQHTSGVFLSTWHLSTSSVPSRASPRNKQRAADMQTNSKTFSSTSQLQYWGPLPFTGEVLKEVSDWSNSLTMKCF